MLSHPIDHVLKPTAELAGDALIIAVAHLPQIPIDKNPLSPAFGLLDEEITALSETREVIEVNQAFYDAAIGNMQRRGEMIQQAGIAFLDATDTEKSRMAARGITGALAPATLLKAASGMTKMIRKGGSAVLSKRPVLPESHSRPAATCGVSGASGGGEYTSFFPPGSVGAAKSWSIKARLSVQGLPNQGRARYVPMEGYNPSMPLPRGNRNGYIDRFGNEWVKGPSRTLGEHFEWDFRLSPKGERFFKHLENSVGLFIKDVGHGPYVNISPVGHITH
jgi:filamentous hemagglutinin